MILKAMVKVWFYAWVNTLKTKVSNGSHCNYITAHYKYGGGLVFGFKFKNADLISSLGSH